MNTQIATQLWIVKLLRRYQQLTFAQINEHWQAQTDLSHGLPMPRRTFYDYRVAIGENLHIYIDCDRRTKLYYIDLTDDSDLTDWLLSSFSYSNLSQQTEQVRQRILLAPTPCGMKYFDLIVEAFRAECCLQATYHKFGQQPYQCLLRPYVLKAYEGRWYLLARKNDEPILKTFALDRFEQMALLPDQPFLIPDDFSTHQYFLHTYGVYHAEGLPPVITLRATGRARNYLRLSPLHPSQVEAVVDADTSLFHLQCHATPDLRLAILRQGSLVEVLEPQQLRTDVADEVRRLAQVYGVG